MSHTRKIVGLILLLGLVLVPASSISTAQDDGNQSCSAITRQAFETTKAICEGAERNEVCYGHIMLEASPQPNVKTFKFDTEGDIASVVDMASLRLSAMDTSTSVWGVALMRLEVNLPDKLQRDSVMVLLFGDIEITNQVDVVPSVTFPVTVKTDGSHARVRSTPGGLLISTLDNGDTVMATGRTEDGRWIRITLDNERSAWVASLLLDAKESLDTLDVVDPNSAIYAPMQAFYMESAANDAACPEAPNSGLMIQTPEGVAQVRFLINEVDIQLGSTVFSQANAGQELTVSVVEGSALVTAKGVTRKATAGSQISVPLDANGVANGRPSLPRAYDWASVMALPTAYMDEPVETAQPISDDDLARLISSQLSTPEEVEEVEETGVAETTSATEPSAPTTEEEVESTIPEPAPEPTRITICHKGTTMEIGPGALAGHLKHGDTIGPCP
jgi:hypothetical protein